MKSAVVMGAMAKDKQSTSPYSAMLQTARHEASGFMSPRGFYTPGGGAPDKK